MSGGDYVRICPSCGTQNAAQAMRCVCGAMIAGVDLVSPALVPSSAAPPATPAVTPPVVGVAMVCAYEDCGQGNPAGSTHCLYCNRPLAAGAAPAPSAHAAPAAGLLKLPAALRERYHVLRAFAAGGAEAELALVQALAGGAPLVAKIYRQGILPKKEVQERMAQVDERYRVIFIEQGISEGYAYEVMEFCEAGSLRDWMKSDAELPPFRPLAENLAACLAAVHATGLLHRDLKPENVLVRAHAPLQLVLTDFGIASVLNATRRFTGGARTLAYAAPESLSGLIDAKSDYWALGMMLLEALQGRHPFDGLSDPVILHHLTTRGIDLAEVTDRDARKLLRGLLLRDPKTRWATAEVMRWVARDPTLPEPVEQGAGASFDRPYKIAGELCATPHELGAALARHWSKGAADIGNGQLLTWFRDVQHDQDVVRLLLEMQHERHLHIDVQLLRLILHLAPGLPAVWRGESVELRAILAKASAALKGDAQAEQWLSVLYEHRVLDAFAAAGDTDAAALTKSWTEQAAGFGAAWQKKRDFMQKQLAARYPNRVVNFDDLVFGNAQSAPSARGAHARLLAMAHDAAWGQRLRERVAAEFAQLVVACPWLAPEFGDVLKMSPAELLAAEALLPEAKKAAEQEQQITETKRAADEDESNLLREEYIAILNSLRRHLRRRWYPEDAREEIAGTINQFGQLLANLRARGEPTPAWGALTKQVARTEPLMEQIGEQIARYGRRSAANVWFLNWGTGLGWLFMFTFIPNNLSPWGRIILISAALAVLAWRLMPLWETGGELQELGTGLPTLPRGQ
jgi:tRNA A-37 threonylcarbamoyl transferase component Bud32